MKHYLIVLLGVFAYFGAIAQDTTKAKPTLAETQMWLKEKTEGNGVGRWPANRYEVSFPDSCSMMLKEMGVDTAAVAKITIEFALIDFDKVSKKVNNTGTLIMTVGGNELRFVPKNPDDFYTRYIKALRRMKELCGGVDDGLF